MVIMLQDKKGFPQVKFLLISVLAVSLAACSNGTETSSSPSDSASSPSTPAASTSPISTPTDSTTSSSTPTSSISPPSPQTTYSPASVAIPGVKNLSEIKFQVTPKSTHGFFDGVSNTSAGPKIQVQKAATFKVSGWAVLSGQNKSADLVLITYGKANALVAVVPVNLKRPDVAKALKSSGYENSGWSTELNASNLTANPAIFNGWAYNSATKEASRLNNLFQVDVLN